MVTCVLSPLFPRADSLLTLVTPPFSHALPDRVTTLTSSQTHKTRTLTATLTARSRCASKRWRQTTQTAKRTGCCACACWAKTNSKRVRHSSLSPRARWQSPVAVVRVCVGRLVVETLTGLDVTCWLCRSHGRRVRLGPQLWEFRVSVTDGDGVRVPVRQRRAAKSWRSADVFVRRFR